jgi:hypothetical protein
MEDPKNDIRIEALSIDEASSYLDFRSEQYAKPLVVYIYQPEKNLLQVL